MAKQCAICEKKGIMARKLNKLRGKYNPTPKKRKYPNLQWVKVPIDIEKKIFKSSAGKRILVCTRCMKTLFKTK